jgi:hypothetical protein
MMVKENCSKKFDKPPEPAILPALLNERHVHQTDEDARAGQWLHGHLAALLPSFGRRGNEILIRL